jgi:hypothetical protein
MGKNFLLNESFPQKFLFFTSFLMGSPLAPKLSVIPQLGFPGE